MPKYFFDVWGLDPSDWQRQEVILDDIESARDFAIGIAESVLRGQDHDGEKRSLVVIKNESEEELEQVLSVSD